MNFFKRIIQKLGGKNQVILPPQKQRTFESIQSQLQDLENVQRVKPIPKEVQEDQRIFKGLKKHVILATILYHEHLIRMEKTEPWPDTIEFEDRLEKIFNKVAYDESVDFNLVLDTIPEIFPIEYEERKLGMTLEERFKYFDEENLDNYIPLPSENTLQISNLQSAHTLESLKENYMITEQHPTIQIGNMYYRDFDDPSLKQPLPDFLTVEEERRRYFFIMKTIKKIGKKHSQLIEELSQKLGSISTAVKYIELLGEKRTQQQQELLDDTDKILKYIKKFDEIIRKVEYYFDHNKVMMPFPMSEELTREFLQVVKDNDKYRVPLEKLLGIPDNSKKSLLDSKLREQKAYDIEQLMERERQQALQYVQKTDITDLKPRNLLEKDQELIRRVNILSHAVKVEKKELVLDSIPKEIYQFSKARSQFGEVSYEQIVEVLKLNQQDPEHYNFKYFSEKLELEVQTLKNIFYNISYPVIQDEKIVEVISFKEMELPKKEFEQELQEKFYNKKVQKPIIKETKEEVKSP